jgi:hypothetical protein
MGAENFEEFKLNDDNFDFGDIMNSNDDNGNDFSNVMKKQTKQSLNSEAKKLIKTTENRLSDEDIERKQKLIINISRYRESTRFKSYLEGLGFNLSSSSLKQKSISELEDTLKELQVAVMNKNSSSIVSEVYYMSTGVIEGVSQHPNIKPKFDLTGFNKMVREDENLQDVLECLNLNYGDVMSLTPEKKILMLTFSSAIKCASVNKMLNSLKNQNEPSASNVQKLNENPFQGDPKGTDIPITTNKSNNDNQPQSLNTEKNIISNNINSSNNRYAPPNGQKDKKIINDATLVAKQHIISFDINDNNNN